MLEAFHSRVTRALGQVLYSRDQPPEFAGKMYTLQAGQATSNIKSSCGSLKTALEGALAAVQDNPQILKSAGRDFVVSLAHVYIGTLLLEHAMA